MCDPILCLANSPPSQTGFPFPGLIAVSYSSMWSHVSLVFSLLAIVTFPGYLKAWFANSKDIGPQLLEPGVCLGPFTWITIFVTASVLPTLLRHSSSIPPHQVRVSSTHSLIPFSLIVLSYTRWYIFDAVGSSASSHSVITVTQWSFCCSCMTMKVFPLTPLSLNGLWSSMNLCQLRHSQLFFTSPLLRVTSPSLLDFINAVVHTPGRKSILYPFPPLYPMSLAVAVAPHSAVDSILPSFVPAWP